MMRVLALLVVASAAKVSPVQKVVQLLDELKAKVESDIANEGKLMDEFTAWCDEEANEKEDAITSSKRTIADASATVADASATITQLERKIGDLTTKISAAEAEATKATGIRNSEHADFDAAEKELLSTVDTLSRATSVLSKNLGLVQGGRVAVELQKLTGGLQQILDAGKVNSHEKSVLQSLLQVKDEDEDLSLQPQATTASYESQSGGILDTVADMKEKAEGSLSGLRKDEMEATHAYAMLKQGLDDEVAVMKRQLADASQTKSTIEEELHAAEEEASSTTKTLHADTEYLSELKNSCAAKAAEWTERQKSAGEETEAILKAKDVLTAGVKAFLQTSVRVRRVAVTDVRATVVATLRKFGKDLHSTELLQLASRAESDPFEKVRGLIEGMIQQLMKAAAAEADQKAFCDEEKAGSTKSKGILMQKLDKVSVRIEKAEAGKAKLQEQIKKLEAEVAAMDAGTAEALKIRQEEHEEYVSASTEYKASAKAIARAITVLDEYYSGGSSALVQTGAKAGPAFGSAKGDVASTIVGLLEVAESDFTRLLAEAEAEEESAANAYEELVQESKVTKASKIGDIKGKESQIGGLETALLNYKEDHATVSSELDAVLTYLDKLKPQCETKVMSYAERKARREQEIEGLREALASLSVQGAFLQQKALRGA